MCGVKGRRFIVLFKQHSIRWFMKMSVYDHQLADRAYFSDVTVKKNILSEFYPQDGGESQLALKLRHCHPMYRAHSCDILTKLTLSYSSFISEGCSRIVLLRSIHTERARLVL